MANVLFKRGPQANLPSGSNQFIQDGAFYLTTDTNRLYYGENSTGATGSGSLKLLNQTV
jgi:hypothetical protein